MKILIDAHMVGFRETGNETYIVNLIRGLAEIAKKEEIYILARKTDVIERKIKNLPDNFNIIKTSNDVKRILWDVPFISIKYDIDIVFMTYFPSIFTGKAKRLTLIHDVSYKRNPRWFSFGDRIVLNIGISISAIVSHKILTISSFSMEEIKFFYTKTQKKIEYIYESADNLFRIKEFNKELLVKNNIKSPFILFVGNLQPRKNLVRLINAYAQAKKEGLNHYLVIAGKAMWRESEIYNTIIKNNLKEDVVFTGYVKDDDLPYLYSMADFTVYPSLYEGFGLPPLESMMCGTPVLTSNITAIPEIVKDSALLINPYSEEEIKKGILELARDENLKKELKEKGIKRAKEFSWKKTAEEFLRLCYKTCKSG